MGFISWWKGESEPTKQSLFDSFLDMPFILKILTLQTFGFGIISFAFCFPIDNAHINGELVKYDYILASGVIWFFMFSSLGWLLSGYMMLRRLRYSRETYLIVIGLFSLGLGVDFESWINLLWGIPLQLGVLGLYLYMRKPVKVYFSLPLRPKPVTPKA
jgi:hypothetical protein